MPEMNVCILLGMNVYIYLGVTWFRGGSPHLGIKVHSDDLSYEQFVLSIIRRAVPEMNVCILLGMNVYIPVCNLGVGVVAPPREQSPFRRFSIGDLRQPCQE